MREKDEKTQSLQQIKDKPVPPVKGAVVDREDVRLWPENGLGKHASADLADTIVFDSWL